MLLGGCDKFGSQQVWFDDVRSLNIAYLEILNSGDQAKLENMLITREEYEQFIYPTFPESAKTGDFDLMWKIHAITMKERAEVVIINQGRKKWRYNGFYKDAPRQAGAVKLHTNLTIKAVDPTDEIFDLRGTGIILEIDGKFKLYTLRAG